MRDARNRRVWTAAAVALLAAGALAALAPVNKTFLGGLAVDGYDVVAYFSDGKPVKGSSAHTVEWNGAVWRFASAGHQAAFEREPERYAPAYGGYCAWAVANGYSADADPEAWAIVDGRLYLNYDKKVQAKWRQDVPGNIAKADVNWPKLLADG
jgi:YHS domain-containing protein